jgi:hypothetical protein
VGLQINDDTTAPKNPDLLRDLHVTLVRWNRSPAAADSELISAFSREEVTFVIPPDPTWVSVLQDDARALVVSSLPENAASTDPRWVHELFDELNGFPRPRFFFLVSLSGPIDERSLAAGIARLGWDRVHLDLVPWAKRGDEEEIWSFLEELKDAGEFPSRHMWAMLGGNLEHAGR